MALTKDDLNQIKMVVNEVVHDVVHNEVGPEFKTIKADIARLEVQLAEKASKTDLDRMEGRLTAALGLVERDHDTRLGNLEMRVERLEQAAR